MAALAQSCPRHRFKWGLVVGLGVGAVAGVLGMKYWLRRQRKTNDALQGVEPPLPVLIEAPPPPEIPAGIGQMESLLFREYNSKPTIRSYTLPAPGVDAIRLVSSTDKPYTVMVRVVDPAGAFGMFSFDATTLNNAVAIPTGENIIIPVGQWQSVPMPPYSALYGRGSVANVVVSVTGAPSGKSVLNELKPPDEIEIAA